MDPEDRAEAPPRARPAAWWSAPVVLIALLLPAGQALQGAAPISSGCGRPSGDAPSCAYTGRPLIEALNDLRSRGLNLIFSSDLVGPDMIVEAEPPEAAPRQVLDRLLAPFGLEARNGPAGTVLVVRADRPSRAGTAGASQVEGPGQAGGPSGDRRDLPRSELRERVRVGVPPGSEPEPRTTLRKDDIERLPAIGGDASRTLTWLPGIAAQDKSAQFSIRGGERDEALVILDGLGIEEPFHLKDFLAFSSIVDAAAIGRMDVLTGIFPAEYGDRMSGVIDLSTADPDGAERTAVGLSLVNGGLLSGGRFGDGEAKWLVSARSWRPDAVLDVIDPGGEDIDPSFNDLLGKVQVPLPGGSILSAHVLASRDDLDYRSDLEDDRVKAGDDHRYVWLNWKTPWTARLYSQTQVASGRVGRNRRGVTLDDADGAAEVEDARSYACLGLKQDWIFAAGDDASLKWGLDTRQAEAEYAYRSHVTRADSVSIDRDLALSPSGNESGVYFAGRLRVLEPLTVEVGVRRDRQTLTRESETSPRVNLAWALGERSVVRAGWGRFHQPQGMNELQIEDGVLDFFPAQRAEHWQVDFDHLSSGGLALGLSVYFKEMTRLRPRYENLFDPIQLFPESRSDRVRVAPRRAVARGLEIELGRDLGRSLHWRTSYALALAEDRIDGAWVPRSWDQRHTIAFNLDYRRGERWRVGLAGVYHSGWPTTDVQAEQVRSADGSLAIRQVLGPRNALRYPAYHRLDLEVTRRFKVGGGTLDVYLEVTNLYGRRNVCCAREFEYLPQADGTVRVDRTEGYWLRQLPIVGLTWEF